MGKYRRTKIAIIMPNLKFGGAERVVIDLANYWSRNGMDIDLVVIDHSGEYSNQVYQNVNVINLDSRRMLAAFVPIMKYLKNTNAEIVWVNLWPLTAFVLFCKIIVRRNMRIYVTHHNQLTSSYIKGCPFRKLIAQITLYLIYPAATGVSCVSRGLKEELIKISPSRRISPKVIYNPLTSSTYPPREVIHAKWCSPGALRVLSVGELKIQKNHELLIDSIAVVKRYRVVECVIVGDGVLKSHLQKKIDRLGLVDVVRLVGYSADPFPWYRTADVFVLTSDWEGFGNVIVEALSVGLPVFSTNCKSGPAEILEGGKYGKLFKCGDTEGIAMELVNFNSSEIDKQILISRSFDFDVDKISAEYLHFFANETPRVELCQEAK